MPVTGILSLEMLGFLCALFASLAYLMMVGRIQLKGLFRQKNGAAQLSFERIQLLVVTIAVCLRYLTESVHLTSGNMSDVTNGWLYLFGASSSIYLVRKAWTTRSRLKRNKGE